MLMDRKITFDDYRGIIQALRDPEKGCPWDKAQTHESLKTCMIHEMTEAVAAVNLLTDTGDADNLSEELGDVLLQVEGLFSLDDVIQKAGEKMIRRHPHVFSSEAAPEKEEVPGRWEAIKQAEKQGKSAEYEKRKKEAENLRNSLSVGDEITTIGGMTGTVCAVKENTIVFETGADRVRIEITKWAVSTKNAAAPEPAAK